MTAPEPGSPFVISVHELRRAPGEARDITTRVAAPEALGTAVLAVPAGAEIELDLRLESVMEGIWVSGRIRGLAVGECVRCLDPIEHPLDVTIEELYAYPGRPGAAPGDDDAEPDRQVGEEDLVDLEPAVRDAIVLALPFGPVCRPDCPGLCPQCGVKLADHPGHHHDVIDQRWSQLRDLLAAGGLAPGQTEQPSDNDTKEEG
ncbi:MAG: DUF177 domain-containing protein [Bifidobacteriaceae bacterium]|nr:DUF177 domain-containing protein [Bifidobacteriaceae bacterium]